MHVNYAIIIGMTASMTKNKVLPSLADITSEQRIINPEKDGLDGIPAISFAQNVYVGVPIVNRPDDASSLRVHFMITSNIL